MSAIDFYDALKMAAVSGTLIYLTCNARKIAHYITGQLEKDLDCNKERDLRSKLE